MSILGGPRYPPLYRSLKLATHCIRRLLPYVTNNVMAALVSSGGAFRGERQKTLHRAICLE